MINSSSKVNDGEEMLLMFTLKYIMISCIITND